MVEIGGQPILWHIMKHYAHYGYKEFYICKEVSAMLHRLINPLKLKPTVHPNFS